MKILCPYKDRCPTIKFWCDPETLDYTFKGSLAGKDFIREVCCTDEHKNCTMFMSYEIQLGEVAE